MTAVGQRARRGLAAHPKFYLFDTGVFHANRPAGPLDSSTEIDGLALEALVAQHLHAWCDYSHGTHTLHYWQTRSRNEVDFVIYGESGIYALEVKEGRLERFHPAPALRARLSPESTLPSLSGRRSTEPRGRPVHTLR